MSTSATGVLSAVSKLDPTGLATKVIDIVTTIHGKYEQMKDNKETCEALNKQISIIGLIVKDLRKTKQIYYCAVILDEVHGCLTNCLKLVDSITTVKKGFFSKAKDFLSSDSNKSLISKLTTQLHDLADILNLALTAQTSKNMQEMMKLMTQKQAEKLPEIQKLNKELEQNVDTFVKNMSQIINVSSSSNSTATANNAVNVVINSPIAHQSGRDSPPLETRFQHMEEEKRLYVLKRLKELFRDRDKGEKSKNFQTYNDVLENYGCELGYKDGQHTLYINDEPVLSVNALKEITKLISTVQSTMKSTTPQYSNPSPSPKAASLNDAKDKKDTKEKIEPISPSLQISSIELMNMDFKGMLALANQGHAMAQYRLGRCYQNGENGCVKNDAKALEWYQKAVAKGNGCAQRALGYMYHEGLGGLQKDPTQALKLYQDARESLVQLEGDVFVQFNLGLMYHTGQGVTQDLKQAAEWYQKAADQGDAAAQSNLQGMSDQFKLQNDAKDKKDTKEKIEPIVTAFNQLKINSNSATFNTSRQMSSVELMNMDFNGLLALANQGHAMAQYRLGRCYRYGENGCVKSDTKAVEWFQKSVAQGNGCAQYSLGDMYQTGLGGLKEDPTQALKLYQNARESFVQLEGDVFVQNLLGLMYYTGQGVTLDLKQAAEWFQKAANQGYAVAQNNLALMYQNGQGVVTLDWYEKAANQGHIYAQRKLGFIYTYGEGVTRDLKKGAEWFQKAANQGDSEAQNNLWLMYQNGQGVTLDWYEKAANQGHIYAQRKLGFMYAYGEGVTRDLKKAAEWLQKVANQGDSEAQCKLGCMYAYGEGVTLDLKQAAEWYEKAANQGITEAQYQLGRLYKIGEGVTLDLKKAVEWFEKAANQGDSYAQYQLGMLYQTQGVTLDLKKAAEWYEKAADKGITDAQYQLGLLYQTGQGVTQDPKQAAVWFQKAADKGYAVAQNNLALMYQTGQGVTQDPKQAAEWFQKAANQGDSYAQYQLGLLYQTGQGVTQDPKQAAEWFQKAAARWNADAQYQLGLLYQTGQGVSLDLKQAAEWFQKAADQGHTTAQSNLQGMSDQFKLRK